MSHGQAFAFKEQIFRDFGVTKNPSVLEGLLSFWGVAFLRANIFSELFPSFASPQCLFFVGICNKKGRCGSRL